MNAIALALTRQGSQRGTSGAEEGGSTPQVPHHEFSLVHPTGVSAMDVDIIKLTAQYTAVSGRQFLKGLAQREQRNPQFDFLKPTHMLFSYFTALVDAYTKILVPSDALWVKLREGGVEHIEDGSRGLRGSSNGGRDKGLKEAFYRRKAILVRIVRRWQWERDDEDKKAREQAESDRVEMLYRTVDWHDFVVVETIEFPDSDIVELAGNDGHHVHHQHHHREGQNLTDDGSSASFDTGVPPPLASHLFSTANSTAAPDATEEVGQDREDDDMDVDMDVDADVDDDNDEAITVVQNYEPDVGQGENEEVLSRSHMVDPLTKRVVLVSEMSEHMRIQLLDPKWREEQKRLQEKTAQETMAEDGNIASALNAFAKQRGDIFGSTEEEEEALLRERAKATGSTTNATTFGGSDEGRLVWDGTAANMHSVQAASLNRFATTLSASSASSPSIPLSSFSSDMTRVIDHPLLSSTLPAPQPPAPAVPLEPVEGSPQASQLSGVSHEPKTKDVAVSPGKMPPLGNVTHPCEPHQETQTQKRHIMPDRSLADSPKLHADDAVESPPPSSLSTAVGTGTSPAEGTERTATTRPNVHPSTGLKGERDYASSVSLPLQIYFELPVDSTTPSWNLDGSTVSLSLTDIMVSVKDLKAELSAQHCGGMPNGRFQVKSSSLGFLKDRLSVAHYNLKDGELMSVSLKTRGKRSDR